MAAAPLLQLDDAVACATAPFLADASTGAAADAKSMARAGATVAREGPTDEGLSGDRILFEVFFFFFRCLSLSSKN